MKRKSLIKLFLWLFGASIIFFAGCQNSPIGPTSGSTSTDQEAMAKLVEQDSSISSFQSNYNEDGAMSYMGKTNTAIYPIRVGQKVHLVNRNIDYTIMGDSAYAKVTSTFEGVLYIYASYASGKDSADTTIQKPFTSVITRNVIFIKTPGDTNATYRHWRIAAVSLASGGVVSPNINITKITVFLSDSDTLEITDPGSYYLTRWTKWWRLLPIIPRQRSIKVDVQLYSTYSDTDFVTLTYGCDLRGLHRAKKKFELVSSTQSGSGYVKVYEQSYETHQWPGIYSAVINAFPHQVIFDDSAAVESSTWGIPYFVR
jgi:hypothetical protein